MGCVLNDMLLAARLQPVSQTPPELELATVPRVREGESLPCLRSACGARTWGFSDIVQIHDGAWRQAPQERLLETAAIRRPSPRQASFRGTGADAARLLPQV